MINDVPFTDEFSKMKDEVPPPLIDAHIKSVEEAMKEGKPVDANFGLDKTGIAGTGPEKEEEKSGLCAPAFVNSLCESG